MRSATADECYAFALGRGGERNSAASRIQGEMRAATSMSNLGGAYHGGGRIGPSPSSRCASPLRVTALFRYGFLLPCSLPSELGPKGRFTQQRAWQPKAWAARKGQCLRAKRATREAGATLTPSTGQAVRTLGRRSRISTLSSPQVRPLSHALRIAHGSLRSHQMESTHGHRKADRRSRRRCRR